jgi:hypothetical protein
LILLKRKEGDDLSVYEKRRKKSKLFLGIRLAVAILMLLEGVSGWLFLPRKMASVIDDDSTYFSDALVRVESQGALYYGYTGSEGKATARWYFVPIRNKDGEIIKIYAAESKKDYRSDEYLDREERPVREFMGLLRPFRGGNDYDADAKLLAKSSDFTEEEARALLADTYISTQQGEAADISKWVAIAGALLFVFTAVALFSDKKTRKRMQDLGVNEHGAQRFEEEYARGDAAEFDKVALTQNWLLNKLTGNVALYPLQEVVWAYGEVTRHRTYGIPTGKTYALQVYFSTGWKMTLPAKAKTAGPMLEAFAARCKGAFIGYSAELQDSWKKDKPSFAGKARAAARQASDTEETPREEGNGIPADDDV